MAWLFLLAGVMTGGVAAWRQRRSTAQSQACAVVVLARAAPSAIQFAPTSSRIFWIFAKAGAVVGSGLAIGGAAILGLLPRGAA